MIQPDELPDDAADWSSVAVQFPVLPNDNPASCPGSEDEVFEYVQTESGDVDEAVRDRLMFCRTAKVADTQYWVWKYTESDGEEVLVTYRLDPDGSTTLGLANANGLSLDQFLLADYYGEVYWS